MSATRSSSFFIYSENRTTLFKYRGNRDCFHLSGSGNHFETFTAFEMVLISSFSYIDWDSDKLNEKKLKTIICKKDNPFRQYLIRKSTSVMQFFDKIQDKILLSIFSIVKKLYIVVRSLWLNYIRIKLPRSLKSRILAPECKKRNFVLKWFFSDWHEGIWHDTEVLIAENNQCNIVSS